MLVKKFREGPKKTPTQTNKQNCEVISVTLVIVFWTLESMNKTTRFTEPTFNLVRAASDGYCGDWRETLVHHRRERYFLDRNMPCQLVEGTEDYRESYHLIEVDLSLSKALKLLLPHILKIPYLNKEHDKWIWHHSIERI